MSRSEDLIIVRAEISDLTPDQQREALAVLVANHRRGLWERGISEAHIRDGSCPCATCETGRYLDTLGLL